MFLTLMTVNYSPDKVSWRWGWKFSGQAGAWVKGLYCPKFSKGMMSKERKESLLYFRVKRLICILKPTSLTVDYQSD